MLFAGFEQGDTKTERPSPSPTRRQARSELRQIALIALQRADPTCVSRLLPNICHSVLSSAALGAGEVPVSHLHLASCALNRPHHKIRPFHGAFTQTPPSHFHTGCLTLLSILIPQQALQRYVSFSSIRFGVLELTCMQLIHLVVNMVNWSAEKDQTVSASAQSDTLRQCTDSLHRSLGASSHFMTSRILSLSSSTSLRRSAKVSSQ
jgi:hypothetical protein